MQVSVEALSNIERRMTVVVPVEQFDEAYDKRILKLSKTVKVDGFRPGKVPLDYIKQRYGDVARQEALSEVIQSSLYAAINQEQLSPVGVPTVEPKAIMPGQPLEYVATLEILPKIDGVKFETDAVEKQVATITEQDIDHVLERLTEQYITWSKAERPAALKDRVVIDFSGAIDGKPFEGGQAKGYPIVLGSNTMIPGFEDGLVGAKAGEEKIVPVTFPENYFAKEVAGKKAEFTVKVIGVSQPEYPALDDAFVKKLGVKSGTVEALRAEVRKNLERELQRVIKAKLKAQVFNKLLEQNSFDIPKSLIEQEAKRVHDQVHPHHEEGHSHSEAEMSQFNEKAKQNVKLSLLVTEFVKQNNISVDQERVQAHLANVAAVYEDPNKVIDWYSKNKRGFAEMQMQILEEQVVEKLLESTKVTEKMVSYNELVSG